MRNHIAVRQNRKIISHGLLYGRNLIKHGRSVSCARPLPLKAGPVPTVDGNQTGTGLAQLTTELDGIRQGVQQSDLDKDGDADRPTSGPDDVQHELPVLGIEQIRAKVPDVGRPLGTSEIQVDGIARILHEPGGGGKVLRIAGGKVAHEGPVLGDGLEFGPAVHLRPAELGGGHHGRVGEGGPVLAAEEAEGQFRRADHWGQGVPDAEWEVGVVRGGGGSTSTTTSSSSSSSTCVVIVFSLLGTFRFLALLPWLLQLLASLLRLVR
mmetsp:Transcript_15932/g.45827  ORF Transcript_15932/g.45827 Transcript_15932/m.45827 type:complete len:266 (+) Transcript_15932:1193-1990(+)